MSSESVSADDDPRPTAFKPWQRLALWSSSSALGLGVGALQIRFLPPFENLLENSFEFFPIQHLIAALWIAGVWLVDKPKYLGLTYPALSAYAWLFMATVAEGMGV